MKVAVVGHVEWCRFVKVDEMPQRGEIVHAIEQVELGDRSVPKVPVKILGIKTTKSSME